MLKKAKLKIAAWGITGVMGAGSLFSGLAVQNVYAEDTAGINATETAADDRDAISISDENAQGVVNDTAADPLLIEKTKAQQDGSEVKTEDNVDKTSGAEVKNTGDTGVTAERSETASKESETVSDTENAKEFSGTGATKDTKAVQAKKNGWVKEKGGYKYYKNGKAYTGWHKMGKAEGEKTEHWSYFGKNGIVYTGWKKMGKAEGEKTEHWCYFGSNGWMRTGWVQFGKGTANPDGNVTKHWSYFGSNGWLRTDWVQFGKGTANPDGNVAKHWSYFGSNGWLRTGWVQLGKGTSNPDGNVKKHWSYFGKDGWLRTGWVQFGKGTANPDGNVAKHWSFFGSDGWLRTGLQNMGKGTSNPDGNSAKHQSYFGDNGWLRVSQNLTINGKKYKADSKGWVSAVLTLSSAASKFKNMTYGALKKQYGDIGEFTWAARYCVTIPDSAIMLIYQGKTSEDLSNYTWYMEDNLTPIYVCGKFSKIFDGTDILLKNGSVNLNTLSNALTLYNGGKSTYEIIQGEYNHYHISGEKYARFSFDRDGNGSLEEKMDVAANANDPVRSDTAVWLFGK